MNFLFLLNSMKKGTDELHIYYAIENYKIKKLASTQSLKFVECLCAI